MQKSTSNVQCDACSGWPHRNADGKVEIPFTCINRVECFDKKNGVETWCLSMEKWNVTTP